MFTLTLLPILIGVAFLADLLELSVLLKLPLLICIAAILVIDYNRTRARSHRLRGVYICAFLVQTLYTIQLTMLKFAPQYASISTGSMFQILGLGVLPCLGFLLLGKRTLFQGAKPLPANILYIGMVLVLLLNLGLAKTSLGVINTERLYGDVARSYSATQSFRVALPTFPGVVSGGVFSGIAAAMGCAVARYGIYTWERIVGCVGLIVGAALIYLTETRSAFLTLVPLAVFVVGGLIPKMARYPRSLATLLVIIPLATPYVYPPIVDRIEDVVPKVFEVKLSRSDDDSFWRLSGRVDIWRDATAAITSRYLTPFGYGPMGEVICGFAVYSTDQLPTLRVKVRSTHAHNMYLNALFESGVFGLLLWAAMIWIGCYYLCVSVRAGQTSSAILLVGLVATTMMGTTESILSVNYVYFVPLLLMLMLEFLLRCGPSSGFLRRASLGELRRRVENPPGNAGPEKQVGFVFDCRSQ